MLPSPKHNPVLYLHCQTEILKYLQRLPAFVEEVDAGVVEGGAVEAKYY